MENSTKNSGHPGTKHGGKVYVNFSPEFPNQRSLDPSESLKYRKDILNLYIIFCIAQLPLTDRTSVKFGSLLKTDQNPPSVESQTFKDPSAQWLDYI